MANQTKGFKIEETILKQGALVIQAINHKLRQQILQLIHKKQRIAVTEIYVKLRLEQSVASQHLAILRSAGLVKTKRDGKQIYFSLDYARINQIQTPVTSIV